MKKVTIALVLLLFLAPVFAQNRYPIIPLPQQIIAAKGNFIINKYTLVQDFTKNKAVHAAVNALRTKVVQSTGAPLLNSISATSKNTIKISISPKISHPEGYQLIITPHQISVKAKTAAGIFYALQSLLQLIQPSTKYSLKIPCARIVDEPRFAHRGMMLDVARHFMPIDFIKTYIDELARLKINRFHWHLTDGQAFRFESKKYPLLQYAKSSQWPTNEGFYTQKEIKALIKYAQDRAITIIPEIDVPAHSQALLAAYPEYGCLDSLGQKFSGQGELCPNEKSIAFVKDLLDEVIAVFPSTDIHIGGDEANKINWKNCPVCKNRMKELNLNTVDELQSNFITNLANYLHSKGKSTIGWDEIMDGGTVPNATVMAWRSLENGAMAAKQNYKVIMSPTSHCYFDYYQSENPNEPLANNGFISLAKVYSFEPVPNDLSEQEKNNILGIQANLWTEQVASGSHAQYMTFPRAIALAEVAWSKPNQKNYEDFLTRLSSYLNGLEKRKVNYAKHFYEIKTNVSVDSNRSLKIAFISSHSKAPLYYTLNGSSPTKNSIRYQTPITVTEPGILKVASIMNNELVDESISQLTINKATGLKIKLSEAPSKYYNKGGIEALTNGVFGATKRYNDNEWLGWNEKNFEGLLNFANIEPITSVALRFFHQPSSWVWLPQKIEIWGSNDGLNYSLLKEETPQVPQTEGIINCLLTIPKTDLKYLKIKAQPVAIIPKNYVGSGNASWLFVDEVVVQ